MEWLCLALGGLFLIMLLGHGLWVVLASLVRAFRPKTPPMRGDVGTAADLFAAEVQVQRLLDAGLIDAVTHARVMSALLVARERGPSALYPPPVPVLPAVLPLSIQPVGETRDPARNEEAGAAVAAAAIPPVPVTETPTLDVRPPQPRARRRPPRRPFREVFAAFLRESNIRWGELVGGLLIVGCSVALVISFWSQIAAKPFFQFGLFTGITAAAFGLGLYAEHRWKLPTTSRGILLIATLLVPLNFLALAALSHGGQRVSSVATLAEVVALALFVYLVWHAARVLAPFWPHLLTAGVGLLSLTLLITRQFEGARSLRIALVLGAAPVLCQAGIVVAVLQRARRWKHVRARAADAMFLLLGVLTYATALNLGLLIFPATDPVRTAHDLAPLLSLAAAPAMACGLLLWRRIEGKRAARARTTATAIAVAATFLMLGCLVLAWPDPRTMLPLAILDLIAFTLIAVVLDAPLAHVPATPCLAIVYVLSLELIRRRIGWDSTSADRSIGALIDGLTGIGGIPLFAAFAVVASMMWRAARRVEALMFGAAAAAVGAINLGFTGYSGFGTPGDPHSFAWICLVYSAASLLAAFRLRRPAAGWAGCLLLAAAFVQFFLTRSGAALPWPTGLLAYASVGLIASALLRQNSGSSAALRVPLRWTIIGSLALALVLVLPGLSLDGLTPIAVRMAWVAALFGIAGVIDGSEPLFIIGQATLALAVALVAIARLSMRPWFTASPEPLLDPWTLQTVGAVLALICLIFALARRLVPDAWLVARWLGRTFALDRILALALAAAFAALAIGAIAPGLEFEFAARDVRLPTAIWSIHASGWGSWLFGATLLATFAFWLRGATLRVGVPVLLALAAACGLLWASGWSQQHAAASAARWALAAVLLVGSIPLYLRHRLSKHLDAVAAESQAVMAFLAGLPILGCSIYAAGAMLESSPFIGPDPHSFFGRIGIIPSYLIPLAIVAGAFVMNAIRERSTRWALAASGVCNLTVSLVYVLSRPPAVTELGIDEWLRLVQINVIAVAAFGLIWQALRQRAGALQPSPTIRFQVVLAWLGNAPLLVPAAIWISLLPGPGRRLLMEVGAPAGLLALLSTLAAALCAPPRGRDRLTPRFVTLAVMGWGSLIACDATVWSGGWAGFHALMLATLAAAGANLMVGAWIARRRRGWAHAAAEIEPGPALQAMPDASTSAPVQLQYERPDQAGGPQRPAIYVAGELLQPAVLRWMRLANGFAILLCFRAIGGDPQRPWWSAGITALIALLWATLACWIAAPRLLYAGGLLLNLAATFWFVARRSAGSMPALDLGLLNILVLSVAGLAALVLHIHVFQGPIENAKPSLRLPFHRFASIGSLIGLAAIVCLLVASDVAGTWVDASRLLTFGAFGASLALALALMWDADASHGWGKAYALGLLALSTGLHEAHYFHQPIQMACAIGASVYVLFTGGAYAAGAALEALAVSTGMPVRPRGRASAWLTPASIALVAGSIAMAFGCDFTPVGLYRRLAAGTAAFAGMAGLVLISRRDRRSDLQYVVLALFPIAGTAWAWGWLPPAEGNASALLRAVVLLGVMAATLILVGWISTRADQAASWPAAARRALAPIAIAWAGVVLVVLGIEIDTAFSGGTVALAFWAVALVLLNLVASAASCVLLALMPDRDPLRLPPGQRGGYVYVAETMLALGFVHLRLAEPWLFGGALAQYWPLLVMAVAFGGIALGELFARTGTLALSSPLFRTGAFLPLLPVIAFWAAPSRVDLSTLLFAVGVFYAVLSAMRRSFAFGVLAALAANGGFWSLLSRRPALAFFVHPQLWLIPAAASVLIAAQLNRDRLSAARLRFVRYCCLMIVYVSSTADIFLNGVRHHPWLPLVLAGLSVTGVLTGILLRLRAFLFLGTAFLGLAILTMIYYASAEVHWTWIWYVAGIGLGASILGLFALFEKKRVEMLALVDGLKRWE